MKKSEKSHILRKVFRKNSGRRMNPEKQSAIL